MKKLLLIVVVIFVFGSIAAYSQSTTRIRFARGAKKTTVSNTLSGFKSKRRYVIRVKAGQRLRIETTRYVTINVTDPSGEDVMDRDLGCNGHIDYSPTVAGDYRIMVYECQKADPWRGRFTMTVRVD